MVRIINKTDKRCQVTYEDQKIMYETGHGANPHLAADHIHRQTAAAAFGLVHNHQLEPAAAAVHNPASVAAEVAVHSLPAAVPAVREAEVAPAAVAAADHSLPSVAGLGMHQAAEPQ